MTLKEFVMNYRADHDLSQRQFAAKCNLSNGYISMLEKEINPSTGKPLIPTLAALNKLARGMNIDLNSLLKQIDDTTIGVSVNTNEEQSIPVGAYEYNPTHRIPILGRISAGLPLYAEEHIEGYTFTDLNGGAEYFALRVKGDSMTAARIFEGDLLIVRRQERVENGEIAVVMVDNDAATVKCFSQHGSTVILEPKSLNAEH